MIHKTRHMEEMIKALASIDAKNRDDLASQTHGMALTLLHEYGHQGDIQINGTITEQGYTGQNPYLTGSPNEKLEGSQKWRVSITGERGVDVTLIDFGLKDATSSTQGFDGRTNFIRVAPEDINMGKIKVDPAKIPTSLPLKANDQNILATLKVQ